MYHIYNSCTSLIWVLYFNSKFLDWHLGFEPTLQLKGWDLRSLQNESHMRASILNTGPSSKRWVPRPGRGTSHDAVMNLLRGLSKRTDCGQRKRAGDKREQMSVQKGAIPFNTVDTTFDPWDDKEWAWWGWLESRRHTRLPYTTIHMGCQCEYFYEYFYWERFSIAIVTLLTNFSANYICNTILQLAILFVLLNTTCKSSM